MVLIPTSNQPVDGAEPGILPGERSSLDHSSEAVAAMRTPQIDLKIGGKPYVLIPKADFDRICERAEEPHYDATKLGRGSVGPDLRARRKQARLTLTKVARLAGIRLETLSRIENGHTDPSVGTVQAILRALEGTAEEASARSRSDTKAKGGP
jgi:DNA-binding XRE family transcriptional regulator